MRTGWVALAILALAASGCDSLGGPARLVQDLRLMGLAAAMGTPFDGELLGGEGTTVCAGPVSISVYAFPDRNAAVAAAGTINRDDPSFIGNGIVEWIGPPRFWLRDDVIVLYAGDDASVDTALRTILGPPFAEKIGFEGRRLPEHLERDCEVAT